MTTSSDKAVVRFGDLHVGFKLVDRQDVALPFFELRLDVMAEKRQKLPVIDEYVLRFADLGLRSSADVTGILGIDPAVVQGAVLSLLQADHVDYVPAVAGREIRLTESGATVLQERMRHVPERSELRLGFDRLLWRLSPRWTNGLENPRVFRDNDVRLLKPIRGRRPELSDIEMGALNRSLAELPTRRREQTDIDIVQLLDIGARTKYLRAEMLIFVADDQSSMRASFIIDGHHSAEHDRAFVNAGGLARLDIELADSARPDEETLRLPPELEALRSPPSELRELEERVRSATRALDEAVVGAEVAEVTEGVTSSATSSTRERLRSREAELEQLRTELEQLNLKQKAIPIRAIQTYEHPDLLEEALAGATDRFLLIAPWVKNEVVTDVFIKALRALCERGIPIHIGYGFKRNDVEKNDAEALKRLNYLANKHDNFVVRELGNTHAKVLIWDDTMVVTSFNWLSFLGDRRRQYRQEEGTFIGVGSYVDTEYERHKLTIKSAR